jgi:hypothetical protein
MIQLLGFLPGVGGPATTAGVLSLPCREASGIFAGDDAGFSSAAFPLPDFFRDFFLHGPYWKSFQYLQMLILCRHFLFKL